MSIESAKNNPTESRAQKAQAQKQKVPAREQKMIASANGLKTDANKQPAHSGTYVTSGIDNAGRKFQETFRHHHHHPAFLPNDSRHTQGRYPGPTNPLCQAFPPYNVPLMHPPAMIRLPANSSMRDIRLDAALDPPFETRNADACASADQRFKPSIDSVQPIRSNTVPSRRATDMQTMPPPQIGSSNCKTSPASPQNELAALRATCQRLEKENRVQLNSFRYAEKNMADLGAQWNNFHHNQMGQREIIYRTYMDAKDLELKNVQSVLESQNARLKAENAELRARLSLPRNGKATKQECKSDSPKVLKRKVVDLTLDEGADSPASTISNDRSTSRFTDTLSAHGPGQRLTLVDGILPAPVPSIVKKLKSSEKFIDPRLAAIRKSPDPPPSHKKLPKIVLAS